MTTESSDNKCTCDNGAIRHPKGRVGHHELLRSNNALARGNGWYPEGEEKGNKTPFRQNGPHKVSEQQSEDDSRIQVNLTYVK